MNNDTQAMRAAFEGVTRLPLKRNMIYKDQYDDMATEDAWFCFQAAWTRQPAAQVAGSEVDDLAMLARQLVRALYKAKPDSPLIPRTIEYLERKGLRGGPLRTAELRDHEINAGLEAAARLIERKVQSYDNDMGNTDPETGTREYPGDDAEWVGNMEEIRAIKHPSLPTYKVDGEVMTSLEYINYLHEQLVANAHPAPEPVNAANGVVVVREIDTPWLAPAAGVGYRRVPIEPTETQLATLDHPDAAMKRIYKAMVLAHPAPERASVPDDTVRLNFMVEHESNIAWTKDGEVCRLFHQGDGGREPMMGWDNPSAWHHDPRDAIDDALAAERGRT